MCATPTRVQTGSALAALTVLKKICDHPKLLTEAAANEIAEGNWSDEWGDVRQHLEQPEAVDAEASCKIVFLLSLLEVRRASVVSCRARSLSPYATSASLRAAASLS